MLHDKNVFRELLWLTAGSLLSLAVALNGSPTCPRNDHIFRMSDMLQTSASHLGALVSKALISWDVIFQVRQQQFAT